MLLDKFTLAIIATASLASLTPLPHSAIAVVSTFSSIGISALFFFHGARLSRQAIYEGAMHWKLHFLILLCTFVFFPILGFFLRPLIQHILTPELILGLVFVCLLPSTVQSSIALTSIAGGNVAAAICSASLSSLLGVFITPLLLTTCVHINQSLNQSVSAIITIVLQLFLPFVVGHLLQSKLSLWLDRRRPLLLLLDQGIILLVIYKAFSEAVYDQAWKNIAWNEIVILFFLVLALFVCAFTCILWLARSLKLSRADEITMTFCGSKKSLATGVTIANAVFPSSLIGIIVLPLMFYHQLQLIFCTFFAQRYALKPK